MELTGDDENGKNNAFGGTLIIPKPPFSEKDLEHYLMLAIHSTDLLNDQLQVSEKYSQKEQHMNIRLEKKLFQNQMWEN